MYGAPPLRLQVFRCELQTPHITTNSNKMWECSIYSIVWIVRYLVVSCKRHTLSQIQIKCEIVRCIVWFNCLTFSCELQTPCIITLWYNMCKTTAHVSPLYSCMQCLKHYDLLFKYMNPLSYQIMIFVSLLHPHNPLTFVAITNFLSCMHTPSSPSPSLSILSIAHIHFFL